MTDPTQAKTVRTAQGNSRRYSWPPFEPHEFIVTSVTSAIKGALAKDYLIGWAAKVTAEAAIRDHDIVDAMLKKDDKKGAIAHVKGARNRDASDKGDRGTIVHAAIDAYLQGEPMSKEEMKRLLDEAFVPNHMYQSTAGMISAAMEFLFETEPKVHWNEATVYSREHHYAGTADLICEIMIDGKRQPAIVDFKTSKAIYDDVALQLVAYARADFVGLNDGTEDQLVPKKSDLPIKYGVVIRPKANGTYERADFNMNDDLFQLFLHCKGVTELMDEDTLGRSRRPTTK